MNITISHKTGRRVGNSQTGVVTHARIGASWQALCGTEPGRRGGWTAYPTTLPLVEAQAQADELVTCQKCRKKLREL